MSDWIKVEDRLPATPKGGGWSDAVLVCYPLKEPEKWKDEYPNGWMVTDRRIFVGFEGQCSEAMANAYRMCAELLERQ